MDPKDNCGTRKLRFNVNKKRNLHLKYIPLNGRRKNKSEPMLTKRGKNPKVKKPPIIVNYNLKKHTAALKKYPDAANKVKNLFSSNDHPNMKNKTTNKHKLPTKTVSKKCFLKINPTSRAKQGYFTEKIVSMWHYAKSFLGFNSNASTSTANEIKCNEPVNAAKQKRFAHDTKKPLIRPANEDSKERNQHQVLEKNTKNQTKIIEIYRSNLQYEKKSKVNDKSNNKDQSGLKLQHDNKDKAAVDSTGNVQLQTENHCEFKDKEEDLLNIGNKLNCEETGQILKETSLLSEKESEEIKALERIVLNDDLNDNKIESLQYQNLPQPVSRNVQEIEMEKLIVQNQQLKNNKSLVSLCNRNTIVHETDLFETDNQITQKDSIIEIATNTNENREIEVNKLIIIKDKSKEGITIEINTNQPVREMFTKTNCYKTALPDTNATIIMEIKKVSNSIQEDNLAVNYAALDDSKKSSNCEQNLLCLLNKFNVNKKNIATSKALTNKKKKAPSKVAKIQHNLDKKTPSTKVQKINDKKSAKNKSHHKDTKKYERSRNRNRNSSRHGIKRRKCSICRGYISRDRTHERKTEKDKRKRCNICNKQVTCLYHHTKRNHPDKKVIKRKEVSLKKTSRPKNRSRHNFQKKKRTLTACTNSRRNSFKNKKLKKSDKVKKSTLKYNNPMPCSHTNSQISNSLIYETDSDSDSDRQEATKVFSWCYLHYALNTVQYNKGSSRYNNTDEKKPFLLSYCEFCNVDQAFDSDNSSDDESSSDDF